MSNNKGANMAIITPNIDSDTKCSHCPGSICCNYVTQSLDTPRSMADFDVLLWQMAHKNVEIYKDEDGWFLVFLTVCGFLQPGGQCGIYTTRPQLCRDYSNDFCEFDEPAEKNFEFYFRSYKELDEYCRRRFRAWEKRFK